MTFSIGHVHGGTGAGRKRPMKPQPKEWTCGCGVPMPGYLRSCIACGAKRPDR